MGPGSYGTVAKSARSSRFWHCCTYNRGFFFGPGLPLPFPWGSSTCEIPRFDPASDPVDELFLLPFGGASLSASVKLFGAGVLFDSDGSCEGVGSIIWTETGVPLDAVGDAACTDGVRTLPLPLRDSHCRSLLGDILRWTRQDNLVALPEALRLPVTLRAADVLASDMVFGAGKVTKATKVTASCAGHGSSVAARDYRLVYSEVP